MIYCSGHEPTKEEEEEEEEDSSPKNEGLKDITEVLISKLALYVLHLLLLTIGSRASVHPIKTVVVQEEGFHRASHDDELCDLYRDNILHDMSAWADESGKKTITIHNLVRAAKTAIRSPYVSIIVVRAGKVHVFADFLVEDFALLRMTNLQSALSNLISDGSTVPDTLFVYNSEDEPLCFRLKHGCNVPMFTSFKRCVPPIIKGGDTAAEWQCVDKEVLLPNFSQKWDALHFYPWAAKLNKALMRGSFQRTMTENSTRYKLAEMCVIEPQVGRMLDAGLVYNRNHKIMVSSDLKKGFVSMPNASRWRFLISTDGHTASSRLGHLLGVNSVVLKERSIWIEYYYRSLQEGVDHLEFTVDDIKALLLSITAQEHEEEMKAVVLKGQQFAYRYLHEVAKALYVRQAITEYNKLFQGEMESFVRGLSFSSSVFTSGQVIKLLQEHVDMINS
ncbi:hypothetical protein CEUSTIGMA_g224.t1 [Chlamydomonas eustigma]|uniref:Glycosyl transferase CAP10 domain-containing protein n=1 Tax=Chlamydomonas eustigma TaxID=1157962 RepID=A0A250WPK6_9CHLO|nr:hypothetical protein CEUSTIGMA_g224.t1 [Chlamydomonas eustigma]|eukprot:GAX72768.1 hypothetical protein CEUSTIGMA_g224.t1 [Chlamydomonas eustigma]